MFCAIKYLDKIKNIFFRNNTQKKMAIFILLAHLLRRNVGNAKT